MHQKDSSMKPLFPSLRSKINPPVFFTAAVLILLLVSYTAMNATSANASFTSLQKHIVDNLGWLYILTVGLIFIAVVYLGISRYGDIKLGPDHATPDYTYASWFAMLFCAGMGIGLMFFGVAEPVMHYLVPPLGQSGTVAAAQEAMKLTFFHWGLHAWAIYAIVGLILAFFSFRHGLPLTLRSALYPIIGERIYGPIGHAADVFAIIGTVFGVATSMGYGVLQINAGLNYLFEIPVSQLTQITLIVIVTTLATLSVVSGLNVGLRRLSELNLILAVIFLILIGILGPTVLLMKAFVENTGAYLSEIISKTFNLYAYQTKSDDWLGGWTLLYWGWWLSWSPFVGLFIARVSRGRTIREFVIGVMLAPAGFTLLWMTFFGNSAIDLIMHHDAAALANTVQANVSLALFKFLEYYPFSSLLSGAATVMVIIFFVTSADSGAMVVDMLASGGDDDTPIWQRVFWSSLMGVVAIALLFSGGLAALQTATIAAALPYSVVLLVAIYGLLKALRVDVYKRDSQQMTTLAPVASRNPMPWQRRLRNLAYYPKRSHVKRFVEEVVCPAMLLVGDELKKQNIAYEMIEGDFDSQAIIVNLGNDLSFSYQVRLRSYVQPAFAAMETENGEGEEEQKYYRAEIYLGEGGQDYDIMGWTKEQVINDILDQYEKHLYFLHLVR